MSDAEFGRALIAEAERRLFEESVPRIKQCLAQLTTEEIWRRPNAATVSVGNLVLHLCGNMGQWIGTGLGGQPDNRKRSTEFTATDPIPTAELLTMLDRAMSNVKAVFDVVDPATLLEKRPVQAYEESGLSIIVHVVEHFSYHTGQITYFVKTNKAIDLKYYDNAVLESRGGVAAT